METTMSKSERTRQFIIETTAAIFNKQGYAGTSMSDLTQATGLTKGSIYGNFENKEEVALAAFDYNLERVNRIIQEKVAKARTYQEKILAYADVYDHFNANHFPNGGCPVLNTAVEADDTHPLLRDRAAKGLLRWKRNLEDLLKAGAEAGEFKEGIDYAQVALSVIALFEGGIMMAKVTGNPRLLDKINQTVVMLITQLRS